MKIIVLEVIELWLEIKDRASKSFSDDCLLATLKLRGITHHGDRLDNISFALISTWSIFSKIDSTIVIEIAKQGQ